MHWQNPELLTSVLLKCVFFSLSLCTVVTCIYLHLKSLLTQHRVSRCNNWGNVISCVMYVVSYSTGHRLCHLYKHNNQHTITDIKITAFWNVTECSLVCKYQCVRKCWRTKYCRDQVTCYLCSLILYVATVGTARRLYVATVGTAQRLYVATVGTARRLYVATVGTAWRPFHSPQNGQATLCLFEKQLHWVWSFLSNKRTIY
jgi:hypothetical protein